MNGEILLYEQEKGVTNLVEIQHSIDVVSPVSVSHPHLVVGAMVIVGVVVLQLLGRLAMAHVVRRTRKHLNQRQACNLFENLKQVCFQCNNFVRCITDKPGRKRRLKIQSQSRN